MPNMSSKIIKKTSAVEPQQASTSFMSFSKQFSHFAICHTFLSYLEVSDYLKLRRGCLYLHDCYNYTVLEILIKFGNLDEHLRKNLWENVCPIMSIQGRYREKIDEIIYEGVVRHSLLPNQKMHSNSPSRGSSDFGSVYCNVYSTILGAAENVVHLVKRVNHEIESFKNN